ncbi:MAG: hypothetical protein NVV82_23790 [Sporocytophaga sp.]|nr:hypothetical protein [Sporocytophaga sp.]
MKNLILSWTLFLAIVGLTFMSCKKDKDSPKNPTPTSFKDPRDQKTYKLVTISGQTWFAENLNYEMPGSSVCANDSCDKYGRLYTGPGAKVVCPAGYHLPTDAEWRTLEHNLGMPDEDTAKIVELRGVNAAVGINLAKGGKSGFNALIFQSQVVFWASDAPSAYPAYQYFRALHPKDSSVYRTFSGNPAASWACVRCLKN